MMQQLNKRLDSAKNYLYKTLLEYLKTNKKIDRDRAIRARSRVELLEELIKEL